MCSEFVRHFVLNMHQCVYFLCMHICLFVCVGSTTVVTACACMCVCVLVLIKSDKWWTQRKRRIPAPLLFLWETSLKKADINNSCHAAILPTALHCVCVDMSVCECVSPLLTVSHRRKSAKKTKVKDVFILTHAKSEWVMALPLLRHTVKCVCIYVVCVCSIFCFYWGEKVSESLTKVCVSTLFPHGPSF